MRLVNKIALKGSKDLQKWEFWFVWGTFGVQFYGPNLLIGGERILFLCLSVIRWVLAYFTSLHNKRYNCRSIADHDPPLHVAVLYYYG